MPTNVEYRCRQHEETIRRLQADAAEAERQGCGGDAQMLYAQIMKLQEFLHDNRDRRDK